jgi:hypothetical protein
VSSILFPLAWNPKIQPAFCVKPDAVTVKFAVLVLELSNAIAEGVNEVPALYRVKPEGVDTETPVGFVRV